MGKYLILICFFCLFLTAQEKQYISQFGNDVLQKTILIVRGKPSAIVKFPQGNNAIRFKIEEIFFGQAHLFQSIFIFSIPITTISSEDSWVIFLKPMTSEHCMESIGYFSLQDKEAQEKITMLRKIIALEMRKNKKQKQEAYLQYCLEGIVSEKIWTQNNAFQEWLYLCKEHKSLLTKTLLPKLQNIHESLLNKQIQNQIRRTILEIRKTLPENQHLDTKQDLPWLQELEQATKDWQNADTLEKKAKIIQCIGLFPCQNSRMILQDALQDNNPRIRAMSLFYIHFQKDYYFIAQLQKIALHDPIPYIQKKARQLLQQWGRKIQ
ncbi:MAG: HEAT repeat domain-containing protein [Planctomycetes bacterium]|jgi:hypothetical protein|nr:HEAT repeat domain-containing protein [Planctomycetota bacterium]HNZ66694.1 HEAT repeat domain-containing protein [Planctomycetota bacterium]HPY74416.1 HEAT repeat domain-containing protein [Planctomycetota bacterium]HQA99924.1 HEAT repeat domain-containing protein [Planctomycetota bacterium]